LFDSCLLGTSSLYHRKKLISNTNRQIKMKTSFDPQFLVWYSYPELFIKYADTIYYFQ
jgi:hypothetical protein